MSWFIIVGRHEHDDEDSLFVLQGDTIDAAESEAREMLSCDGDEGCNETAQAKQPCTVYLNYVVSCGEQEPRIMRSYT